MRFAGELLAVFGYAVCAAWVLVRYAMRPDLFPWQRDYWRWLPWK